MPNRKSSEKSLRQSEERRVRNKARRTELKTLRRKIDRAVHDGKADDAAGLLQRYMKRVDQAACHSVMHRNTASRRKSVMARRVASLQTQA